VELECKGIAAVGTENIGGTDYNYFDMIENPPATDTIRCYYTGTAAVTDCVNRITGQIRHTSPETPVIDIDTGPYYDPQLFRGSCQLAAQGTIAWAKTFPDGAQLPASLEAKVVSGDFSWGLGYFFIQEPSRASGIRVNPTSYYWGFYPGDQVTIAGGQVTTVNNQRAIIVDPGDIQWLSRDSVRPLGLNNRAVAGGPFNVYTPGATDAFGLNNIGLLIRTWGLASDIQPSYFYINDGSYEVGVKVDLDLGGGYYVRHDVQAGDYAAVTGIAQLETVGNRRMRAIKPRDSYDIQLMAIAPRFTDITVTPNKAGVDEIVSISFYVDQTLAQNPTVTVNGHPATYYSGGYYYYTYRYTVSADDPAGWATIAISARSSEGLSGSAAKSDALWINEVTFDERGNRRTMRDSRGVTYYEYDVLGRLTKVTEPDGKWIAYQYDLNNNRTKMTVHSDDPAFHHITQYVYNERNLLWKVYDQLAERDANGNPTANAKYTEYTYYPNGLVHEIRYPNGTKAVHSYSERGWLTDLVNKRSDNTVIAGFHYEYAYDPESGKWGRNGTRTAVVEEILTPPGSTPQVIKARVDYEYDDLYRLTREVRSGHNGGDPGVAYEYNFAYDAAGNRTQWQIVGGATTNYTYDAANKMLTAGNSTFTYDDAGNTLTETNGSVVTTYTWDYLNRLAQWQKTGHTMQSYVYNADGIRVSKAVGRVPVDFVLDQNEIVELITDGASRSFVGGPSFLIGEVDGNAQAHPHPDGMGSTRVVSGVDELVSAAFVFDAFGNILAAYGSFSRYGFAGQFRYLTEDDGMQHVKRRNYSSPFGRFMSRDRLGHIAGTNLYLYCMNNPVRYVDPSGEFPIIAMPIIGGAWFLGCGIIGAGYGGIIGFINPAWPDRDSFIHCLATCSIRKCGSIAMSWAWGWIKEIIDYWPEMREDPRDFCANNAGERCAKQGGSCYDCCSERYPRPIPEGQENLW
jgi:RHS repeat-associated protein